MKKIASRFVGIVFATGLSFAAPVAQSQTYGFENPQPGSYQSGLAVFSGWSCSSNVQVIVDGVAYRAAAGTPRSGFPPTLCGGNSNVNFAFLRNFNNFGSGTHTAQLVIDGTNAGPPVTFTVTVPIPSAPFATGLSGTYTLPNFPSAGQTTTLRWQESAQNFAITAVSAPPVAAPGTVLQGGLSWTLATSSTYSWSLADAHCGSLTLNGHTNWRLPTQPELTSFAQSGLALGSGGVWTSTPTATFGTHYFVNLNATTGAAAPSGDYNYLYLRCVR